MIIPKLYFKINFKFLVILILYLFQLSYNHLYAQITDTITASMDDDISQSSPYSNYGSSSDIWVGDNNRWRGLVYFDLSAIPGNAVITNASVILRVVDGSGNDLSVGVYRVTSEWTELDASWYYRTYYDQWNSDGGDFNYTALAYKNVTNALIDNAWNVTSAVQDWTNGTYANYGFIFMGTNSANHEKHFASRDNSTINYRPRLAITYTTTVDSLWLRGNYGTNTTTEGAAISQWTNVYANNSFIQDNTIYRPIYRSTTNLINFNPTIQFDGVNDYLKGQLNYGIFGQNYFTTFSVVKSSGSDKYIWSQYSYRTNSASHSILTQQRVGAYTLFRYGTNSLTTPTLLSVRRSLSNNFHLFYNGTNESSGSITGFTGSFIGNNLLIGSRGNPPSNTFNGQIAEMMIFNRSLSDMEENEINSYLAVKYGLHMTINYLASNGGTIWNQSTDGAYNNGIFGIGKDNINALHQQISSSTSNSYSFLTISTDTNFTLLNSQHAAITNNVSFLMLGSNSNNDFLFQFSEFNASTYSSRIDYEWLVQSTNFSQPVNLKFQGCGSTELRIAYLVKKNGNSNFTSGITEVGVIDSNGVINGVILNNNDYFTVFFKNLSPGGVNDFLRFWAKADYGTILSGTSVVQWKDVANNFYLSQSTSARRPTYITNGQNFNPSISFNEANSQYFDRNTNYNIFTSSYSIYIVGYNRSGQRTFMAVSQTGGTSLNSGIIIETGDPSSLRFLHRYPPSQSGGDNFIQDITMSTSSHNIFSFFRNTNTKHKFWVNGTNSYSLSPITNGAFSNGVFTDLTVGRLGSENMRYLDGEIAEIIIFNNENETSRIKIESYLATKYGISLNDGVGANYIASDSTTVYWNSTANNGYNYDIFGIGKDEISTLNQKQSRSVNSDAFFSVYLIPLIDDILPTTNQLNTSQFESDKSYLMFGNNNDTISNWSTGITMPSKFKYRLRRIWKYQKTGTISNALISINIADLPTNTGSHPLYLLVSNSTDMSNASYYPMTLVGPTWRVIYDFSEGSYITFGYGFFSRLRHGKTVIEGVRFPYK
ncbi:MAG: hypothetical protein H6Q25_512 [Bacteroidetes bacterium]|nr:hypothetical protein [Bacteroidota bacterium]